VSVNAPLLNGDTTALLVAPDDIVIGSRPGVEPVRRDPFTAAALNWAVP
jgi:hypothetical protein